MYMPHPYNSTQPLHHITVEIAGVSVPVYLLPSEDPVDATMLKFAKAELAGFSFIEPLAIARDKVAENHYDEHRKINPGNTIDKTAFKQALKLVSATLWIDGSWAMTFSPDACALGAKHVCASFPTTRPDFTSLVA